MDSMRLARMTGLALIIAVVAAPTALARSTTVDGNVIAPPTAKGKRIAVPLLLTARAERKLGLRRGIVRVLLRPRARLSAPAASGHGKTILAPRALKVGDRVKGVVSLSRKRVKRLRKRSVPAFAVRRASVVARASALSTDDLVRMIAALDARLAALSQRVDGMAASNAQQFAALRGELDSLAIRTTALEAGFAGLGSSLGALVDRVDLLEGLVDPLLLAALQGDVDSLLGRADSLEGVTGGLTTSLSGLTGTVGGLEGSLTTVQGQLGPLLSTVDDLSDQVGEAEILLAEVPAMLAQVDSIDSSLTTLSGRVDGTETLLTGLGDTVDGLTTTVGGLSGLADTVAQQGVDIGTLTGTVDTLGDDLTDVAGDVTGLQGTVGALQTTTTGLTTSVGNLTGQVTTLQGTLSVVCGLPLIDCTP